MAHKQWLLALGMLAAASTAAAARQEPAPREPVLTATAPPGTPDTRYCMRVEPVTGSRVERIKCWTRDEWAEQGVDVDRDWPKEGVRIEG